MAGQAVVIFLGLLLTFSIGALAGIMFFYLYYRWKIKKSYNASSAYRKAGLFLFLGVVLCCFILFALAANVFSLIYHNNYIFGNFLGKIYFEKITNIQGISLRWDSLKYTAGFLKTTGAFFGAGIGKIGTGECYLSRVSLDNYLGLSLVESGVFATIALLLVFWAAISKASGNKDDPVYAFLCAGICILFINMLFFDALNQPVIRIIFWSFVGFLA
ncbi:hypothetical protein EPN54_04010 [bacterium]|nr:MAG: hypothetical protein EPN54_04010 [bacterium]